MDLSRAKHTILHDELRSVSVEAKLLFPRPPGLQDQMGQVSTVGEESQIQVSTAGKESQLLTSILMGKCLPVVTGSWELVGRQSSDC